MNGEPKDLIELIDDELKYYSEAKHEKIRVEKKIFYHSGFHLHCP